MRLPSHLRLVAPSRTERAPSARMTVSHVHADRECWDFLPFALAAFGVAVLAFMMWVGIEVTSSRASSESGLGVPPELDSRAADDAPRSGER